MPDKPMIEPAERAERVHRVKVGLTDAELEKLRSLAARQDRPLARVLRSAFLSYYREIVKPAQ